MKNLVKNIGLDRTGAINYRFRFSGICLCENVGGIISNGCIIYSKTSLNVGFVVS